MAEKYGKKVRELMINEMQDMFSGNTGFIVSSIENIKAADIDVLRKKLRQSGSKYLVVKNTLAKVALDKAGISGLTETMKTKKIVGVGVIKKDPVSVAKLMTEFSKKNQGFTVINGYLEGEVLAPARIKELSELPSREQLIAKLVGTMNGPIARFVYVLSSIPKSIVYTVNAIKTKKEGK